MRILLQDWAKTNGVQNMKAKNLARRNKLKTARYEETLVKRWTIDKDERPPK
jgi:hypothetical protein